MKVAVDAYLTGVDEKTGTAFPVGETVLLVKRGLLLYYYSYLISMISYSLVPEGTLTFTVSSSL